MFFLAFLDFNFDVGMCILLLAMNKVQFVGNRIRKSGNYWTETDFNWTSLVYPQCIELFFEFNAEQKKLYCLRTKRVQ